MAADNKDLGQFALEGIPSAPRGVPQIEVTFDIDANGIVNVSAKDKATNKEQNIRIQASGGLSEDDIQRMVKEAEANADADKKRREEVEVRNQADSMLHTVDKQLKEHGDKVSEEERNAIKTALEDLKETLLGDDLEKIKSKTEALATAAMKLGEAMYKASSAQSEGAANEAPKNDGDENVVDADFTEVDENDKKAS
jgi:molecular chaperone DnaK